jgi:hypothetical protein
MKRNTTPDVQFNDKPLLNGHLLPRTGGEAAPSAVAKRDLQRYYALVASALRNFPVKPEEAEAICAACKDWDFGDISNAQLLYAQVKRMGNAKKGLIDRLRTATLLQSVALIDAAERFHAQDERPAEAFFGVNAS